MQKKRFNISPLPATVAPSSQDDRSICATSEDSVNLPEERTLQRRILCVSHGDGHDVVLFFRSPVSETGTKSHIIMDDQIHDNKPTTCNMASNFVKLCTAALAGSIIGIAYERLPPIEWQSAVKTVSAAGTLVPKSEEIDDLKGGKAPFRIPDVNPVLSAENLKHSAKFGLPSKDNIRLFDDFIISYDRRLRSAAWVIEHMTPEKLKSRGTTDRNRSKFQEDPAIHDYFRSKLADFYKSGYDRGHLAAAGNHKLNQESLDQTFALSNISPQVPEFNRGAWERLETYVRFRANRSKNLYCVSGPLYLPMKARDGNLYVTYRVLGNNHVSVPTHYFKVFLIETNDDKLVLEAFLMPNDPKMNENTKINDYRVPIEQLDVIERASGVIFFDQLSREKVEKPLALPSDYKEGPYTPKKKLLN